MRRSMQGTALEHLVTPFSLCLRAAATGIRRAVMPNMKPRQISSWAAAIVPFVKL
jgi:hypothetical protein